ncbi:hypothetical protein BGW39_008676 [Mortierella sp. 14UC]|nr:hypothetical protein BGW39_008676 [Mortierella sp. 14UC]
MDVPVDIRVLPDPTTREHLTELYYKSHYLTLPMVQREVLRVSFIQRPELANRAITMALTLGLHVRQDEGVNNIMRAYMARVFWCCFVYDSTFSAIGGEPTLINSENITVDMFEAGDLGPEEESSSDQYMLHYVRGWKIYLEIRNYYAQVVQGPQHHEEFLTGRLEQLDQSLVAWQEQLPGILHIVPIKGSLTSPMKAMAAGAQLFCYALIIFLHYPYLPDLEDAGSMRSPDSQGYCTQASLETIRIIGILLEEASWIFELDIAARYALNLAIRILHRNSNATHDPTVVKEARRGFRKSIVYAGDLYTEHDFLSWNSGGQGEHPRNNPMTFAFLPSGLEDVFLSVPPVSTPED